MSKELSPPYIANAFKDFEHKLTLGNPKLLDPVVRFQTMQGYYAGFAEGLSFMQGVMEQCSPSDRMEVDAMVKDELSQFSAHNRKLGAKIGFGHVNTGKTLEEQFPEG